MSFNGFHQTDFDSFQIAGLAARMEAIQERIQPKFKQLGEALQTDVSLLAGEPMFVHIARHARRSVHPPEDTWMAFSSSKRGYKKLPHFQIGLFDDHVFIWFALIYELPDKSNIAEVYRKKIPRLLKLLPQEYVMSFDHTKKSSLPRKGLGKARLEQELIRFRDVKKAEFLAGRQIASDDPVLQNGQAFTVLAKQTFTQLMPLYHMATR